MAYILPEANRITYSQLGQALATLGFIRRQTESFTAYREAEHDAWIILPNMSAESEVGDPHLVTIRNTIIGRGVASSEELQALLFGLVVKPRRLGTARSQRMVQSGKTFRKAGVKKRRSPALGE